MAQETALIVKMIKGQETAIRVGVFRHEGPRKPFYMAYTRYFNPDRKGCCVHDVHAVNGTDAKRIAIAEHREKCERGPR